MAFRRESRRVSEPGEKAVSMHKPGVVSEVGRALLEARGRMPRRARWLLDGEWPAWWATATRRRASRNPVTYSEKCAYKFARDRRALLTTFSDKLLARDYVSERVGADVLVPLVAVADRGTGIPWSNLPREFVCKVNHGSGGTIVVSDFADPGSRLPTREELTGWSRIHVRPEAVAAEDMARICEFWLGLRHAWEPGYYREWGYSKVRPRVFVEELCSSPGRLPEEVKVFCFNGIPRYFAFTDVPTDLYPEVYTRFMADDGPALMDRLVMDERELQAFADTCSVLSAETDMVRVDWMLTGEGPRFSELTNYPGSGAPMEMSQEMTWPELDGLLGSFWEVPKKYR